MVTLEHGHPCSSVLVESPAAATPPGFFQQPTKGHMSGRTARSLSRSSVGSALIALAALLLAGPTFGAEHGSTAAPPAAARAPVATPPPRPAALIDINSASRAQLATLLGIGDAGAQRIIARRPYRTKAELVTANVIPAGIYQSIRHQIIAIQPATPRLRKNP